MLSTFLLYHPESIDFPSLGLSLGHKMAATAPSITTSYNLIKAGTWWRPPSCHYFYQGIKTWGIKTSPYLFLHFIAQNWVAYHVLNQGKENKITMLGTISIHSLGLAKVPPTLNMLGPTKNWGVGTSCRVCKEQHLLQRKPKWQVDKKQIMCLLLSQEPKIESLGSPA